MNRCEINTSKTKIVEIRKQMRNYPEGETLFDFDIVADYKYLGVPIDCSLTMSTYLEALKKKITRLTAYTYKLQLRECAVATRLQVWKTYIKPHFDYAIEMWQLGKLHTKFETKVWPIFFQSLKRTVGLPVTTSNYRTLAALGLWHPKFVSALQFFKSVFQLMRQYNSREEFEESLPHIAQALTTLEESVLRGEQKIVYTARSRAADMFDQLDNIVQHLKGENLKEIVLNTVPPEDQERISSQVLIGTHHKNIYHGGSEGNGAAYLRFLTNRSLNLRRWSSGSNDLDRCAFCEQRTSQEHFMLDCWALKSRTSEFFDDIRKTMKQLIPPKKFGQMQLPNQRILDMIRFLRFDVIVQPLGKKKFYKLNLKINEGFRKLEMHFNELFLS